MARFFELAVAVRPLVSGTARSRSWTCAISACWAWLGTFQNPEVPRALAEYAAAFARRYPWVCFYTPVNEMYVCARMRALDGVWNEQLREDGAFVTASFNLAEASVAMTDAILAERPDAVFINSESSECYQPGCPDALIQQLSDIENERRFLPLDLFYAHEVSDRVRATFKEWPADRLGRPRARSRRAVRRVRDREPILGAVPADDDAH